MTQEAQDQLNRIYTLLEERFRRERDLDKDEDILIQFPMSTEDMMLAAQTQRVVLNRRINRRLKTITVSIPENCVMEIFNNNISQMFFSAESGTMEFPNGISMEDVVIKITNAGLTPAQLNFRCIFSQ